MAEGTAAAPSRRAVLAGLGASRLIAAAGSPSAELKKRIGGEFARSGAASLTMVLAQDGNIVWEQAWGWADKEAKTPATPETIYSLASITKSLTSAGLMILVERGLVRLDAPVDDYLAGPKLRAFSFNARNATVRRIANHTAGLPVHAQSFYSDESRRAPAIEESIRRYGIFVRPPGERFDYSNFVYAILARVVANVSRQPYEDFMSKEVFAPLGMSRTGFPAGFAPNQAIRYSLDGAKLPFYDLDTRGASCAFASARDLMRFAFLHLKTSGSGRKRILSDRSIDELARASTDSPFGVGWRVEERNGVRKLMFGGGMDGVSSWIMMIPDRRVAIVALANTRVDLPGRMSTEVLREMFPGIRSSIEPVFTVPPREDPVPTAFSGSWSGTVFTHRREEPFRLQVKPGLGRGMARFGARAEVSISNLCLIEGRLCGSFSEDIGTDDVRRPHRLRFELTPRPEAVLNGALTSFSFPAGRIGDSLSSFVSLQRRQ